jgi:hypothetical protein
MPVPLRQLVYHRRPVLLRKLLKLAREDAIADLGSSRDVNEVHKGQIVLNRFTEIHAASLRNVNFMPFSTNTGEGGPESANNSARSASSRISRFDFAPNEH